MRSHSLWVLGTFAGLVLAGCATHGNTQRYEQASLQTSPVDAELMSYRIRNWTAISDHELVLESMDGTRYRAETLGPCFGMNSAARLGFENRGGFQQVDRFSSVVLPDGQRCAFQNFNRVVSPASQALDSFEKLGSGEVSSPR
jgi:hypothetical protein